MPRVAGTSRMWSEITSHARRTSLCSSLFGARQLSPITRWFSAHTTTFIPNALPYPRQRRRYVHSREAERLAAQRRAHPHLPLTGLSAATDFKICRATESTSAQVTGAAA